MSTRQCGEVQLILGPMFSGKSTELIRRVKRQQAANRSCVVLKFAQDNRYSADAVVTHDGTEITAIACTVLCDLRDEKTVSGAEVIGVDEGQFFPDVAIFCEEMADKGKTVIVAALDGTFKREPFRNITSLVPKAESIVKLAAVCTSCQANASFTMRLCTDADADVLVVGGRETYRAVCRACHPSAPT